MQTMSATIENRTAVKQLVPPLRFKEFDGEWGLVPLIETADKKIKWSFTGGPFGSDLKSDDYTDEGVRILQLQNIGDGEFRDDYKIFTSNEKADNLLACNIFPKEIIISKMGDPVARACKIPNIDKRYLMASDGIRLATDDLRFSREFVYQSINHPVFRNKALCVSTGSTRKRIGLSELKKIEFAISTLPEQQKIASFLSSVDEKIQLLTRKKEQLEQYKKGVMQQLFSSQSGFTELKDEQDGGNPEIQKSSKSRFRQLRFKDENGNDYPEWEEKRLGDICEMTSSKRVYLSDYVDNGIPFYRGKEISELRLNQSPSDILFITEERYNDYKSKYGVPIKDDVLVTAVGTLGNVLRVRNDEPFYFKDGNVIWLKNIKTSSLFLEILLQSNTRELLKTSIGSTQKALTMVELRKLKFDFPSLPEQQKIATYLSSIDTKIESVKHQITQTQTFKKGLLQQMFV